MSDQSDKHFTRASGQRSQAGLALLLTTALLTLGATHASAQNIISNSGFEDATAGLSLGTNRPTPPAAIVPWVLGSGQSPNVVKVDGTGPYVYNAGRPAGNPAGPESDADDATPSGDQHYLDILDGGNEFWQVFTVPSCTNGATTPTARYNLGGSFSGRGNVSGDASIRITLGNATTTSAVLAATPVSGSVLSTTLAAGSANDPDPWTNLSTSTPINLTSGQVYSYIVEMNDFANFDEASLVLDGQDCPGISINKTTASTPSQSGDTLNYSMVISNAGNVDISNTNFVVSDAKCVAAPSLVSESILADGILAIGETQTYICTSVPVTSDDVMAGAVVNQAFVDGTTVGFGPTLAQSNSSVSTPIAAQAPVADDELNIPGGTTGTRATIVDVLDGDVDPDGTLVPVSVTITGSAGPGADLLVADQGTWSVNTSNGEITFTPLATFTGDPTVITYTVADNDGNPSNAATVSIDYAAQAPVADDELNIPGETTGTRATIVDVLDGDVDPDGTLVPASVTITGSAGPGADLLVADQGTWSVDTANGEITFTPLATFTGDPTAITYTVDDNDGNPSNAATVSIDYVDLLSEIEDDLTSILEEDLANTLTMQSNQISGYSANALGRLQDRSQNSCVAAVNARLSVENILFDTDKAIIKPESHRTLDDIAAILNSCAGSAFEIAGHTDSDASDAYNLDLSQRRVTAILRALTERGVDTTGYVARGYGESRPIATNSTEAGKAQNRRVEFRPLETDGYHGPCNDSFSLVRALDAHANNDGTTANGQFIRDQHDCVTDSREVLEGSLNYSDTGTGQTQSAINLSYRREQYRGSESVFGYFVGLYGSQSDVTRLADGEVRGLGGNGGIYGAKRLQSELFLDYYLGAAAGRHEFDLAFDRSGDTISATGDYRYLAGFAGAALSGQMELGEVTVMPRFGFDYVYTPGADVDVVAELGSLSQVGSLELNAISGGRAFAEIRSDHSIQDGQAVLSLNPRVACYESLGSLDGVCGFGGSIGIESAEQDNGMTYAFEIDGEVGEDYSLGSLTMSVEREVGIGVLSGDADVGSEGAVSVGGVFEVKF